MGGTSTGDGSTTASGDGFEGETSAGAGGDTGEASGAGVVGCNGGAVGLVTGSDRAGAGAEPGLMGGSFTVVADGVDGSPSRRFFSSSVTCWRSYQCGSLRSQHVQNP
ncbi:hypothetical protein [Stenomitos frigidus]|uniref:hypothetical protein n=1 Tax=Stenomitos frigidus TaxID=1886765 RepID=UPI0011B29F57|nr:hypothetical protein [Stenomitos frigidus]